jgi:hypothetical protein
MLLFCAKVSKKSLTAKEIPREIFLFLLFNDCLQMTAVALFPLIIWQSREK